MERYESLVAVHTSDFYKNKEGGNTFICDNKKQADYIKEKYSLLFACKIEGGVIESAKTRKKEKGGSHERREDN